MAEKAEFFSTNDGLIASTNPVWLQWGFVVLIGLFEQFGLRNYVSKMVAMVCQPGPIYGQQSAAAYGKQMTGEGEPHRARQHRRVVCGECGEELADEYMGAHLQTQHGR